MGISGTRHAVDAVEGCHDQRGAALDAGGVARQIVLAQAVVRQLRAGIFPAARGCAVARKVLDASGHGFRIPQVLPLVALHHGFGHAAVQIHILSGGFHTAAPPGIPAQIRHGRKNTVQSRPAGLPGSSPGAAFY